MDTLRFFRHHTEIIDAPFDKAGARNHYRENTQSRNPPVILRRKMTAPFRRVSVKQLILPMKFHREDFNFIIVMETVPYRIIRTTLNGV